MSHRITVAALSDVGCKRRNNEDSFGYDQVAGIYVVSDGMGGSAGGEVASHLAVQETLANYTRMRQLPGGAARPAQDLLYYAVLEANKTVYEAATRDPQLAGMGATLVAVCLDGPNAIVANLGDSRAYLLRRGSCAQITEDHSLAAEQIKSGMLPAGVTPASLNVITKAIGTTAHAEPDLFAAELLPGDRLLLTTDGLMKHVSDPEIHTLVESSDTISQACELLIRTVKERGAKDNVTCLLLEASLAA